MAPQIHRPNAQCYDTAEDGSPCCVYQDDLSVDALCKTTTPCTKGFLPGTVVNNACQVNLTSTCPPEFNPAPACVYDSCKSDSILKMVCGAPDGKFTDGLYYDKYNNQVEGLEQGIEDAVLNTVFTRSDSEWDSQCCPSGFPVGPVCVYGSCNSISESVESKICGAEGGYFDENGYYHKDGTKYETLCDGMSAGVLTFGPLVE